MSNARFAAGSIEELLAAVADGVREAQDALNELPMVDAYGRAQPRYHLPYVDFDISVDLVSHKVEDAPNNAAGGGLKKTAPKIGFVPIRKIDMAQRLSVFPQRSVGNQASAPSGASNTTTNTISSKVAGRIVSIPPGEGQPVPRLAFMETSSGSSERSRTLRFQAANSAGEVLASTRVEFNIDWAASAALSPNNAKPKRAAATRLDIAETLTEDDGQMNVTLTFSPAEPKGAVFLITATCQDAHATVMVTR